MRKRRNSTGNSRRAPILAKNFRCLIGRAPRLFLPPWSLAEPCNDPALAGHTVEGSTWASHRSLGTMRSLTPMETIRLTTGNVREAMTAAEMGYRCIPCLPGTKLPAVKWKRYQHESPTPSQYLGWFDGT